jgi:uncharacterized protein YbaP (TraB family)
MKLRNAGLLVALLAATTACQRRSDRDHGGAGIAHGGSAAPTQAAADPWSKPDEAKDPLPHPLFWKLEKDGHTSYLLGTIHRGIDPTTRLPDLVWQKLDAASTFAMETDLSNADKLDIKRHDGITLKDELGPDYWKKLEDVLGASQAALVLHDKPMMPVMMFALRGLPPTAPMDGVLYGRAVNQHKRIVFLEPFELQVAVLEKWMTARVLRDILDDVAKADQRSKQLLDAYVSGDEAKMLAIADEERADWKAHGHPEHEFDEQMEDLLYKRNASWIAPIENLHADGGGFIAVGAAHTVGPRSIVDLLEKRGFQVTRLTP